MSSLPLRRKKRKLSVGFHSPKPNACFPFANRPTPPHPPAAGASRSSILRFNCLAPRLQPGTRSAQSFGHTALRCTRFIWTANGSRPEIICELPSRLSHAVLLSWTRVKKPDVREQGRRSRRSVRLVRHPLKQMSAWVHQPFDAPCLFTVTSPSSNTTSLSARPKKRSS